MSLVCVLSLTNLFYGRVPCSLFNFLVFISLSLILLFRIKCQSLLVLIYWRIHLLRPIFCLKVTWIFWFIVSTFRLLIRVVFSSFGIRLEIESLFNLFAYFLFLPIIVTPRLGFISNWAISFFNIRNLRMSSFFEQVDFKILLWCFHFILFVDEAYEIIFNFLTSTDCFVLEQVLPYPPTSLLFCI